MLRQIRRALTIPEVGVLAVLVALVLSLIMWGGPEPARALAAPAPAPAPSMTLGASVAFPFTARGPISTPVSATSEWIAAVTAGGATVQDAATITAPATEITAATRRVVQRQTSSGTAVLVRLTYDTGLTSVTSPVVRLYGRTNGGAWQALTSKAGSTSATLTVATTTDTGDGTYKYTTVDLSAHWFDCQGYDEILVGIQTALAGTGTTTNATIDLKAL